MHQNMPESGCQDQMIHEIDMVEGLEEPLKPICRYAGHLKDHLSYDSSNYMQLKLITKEKDKLAYSLMVSSSDIRTDIGYQERGGSRSHKEYIRETKETTSGGRQ